MVECGRLAILCVAAFWISTRAVLASFAAPEQTACQGLHPSSLIETQVQMGPVWVKLRGHTLKNLVPVLYMSLMRYDFPPSDMFLRW